MTESKLRKLCRDLGIEVVHKNHKGWLISKCPFAPYLHEFGTDSNPSFNIHVNHEGYSGYKCFTCKQSGNLSKLINRLGEFREEDYTKVAIRALVDETPENFEDFDQRDKNIVSEREISPLEATIYLRMYPLATEEKKAVQYLKRRAIIRKAAELLDLRYDPDQQRILFPVYDWDRKLYGFTGRTILNTDQYPHKKYPKVRDYAGLPKDKLLLGEHLAHDGLPMLVVEGLFALLSVVSRGACEFCNPVATMGSYMSEAQRDRLIDHDAPVFLLYDGDLPGREGLYGVSKGEGTYGGGGAVDILKPHLPVSVCEYPDGIDDPDNLQLHHLQEMILGEGSILK